MAVIALSLGVGLTFLVLLVLWIRKTHRADLDSALEQWLRERDAAITYGSDDRP